MVQPNPANLPIGGLFAERYEIVASIRAGGMGAVYEVLDRRNQRKRALKVMLPQLASDPRFRDRFEREATVTGKIESEHIVEVLDAGVNQATAMPYLAMELLRGEDLAARISRLGRLDPQETVSFLGQAAMALDRTHAAGVIHRDLKPENLFVTERDDGTPLVKVLDFGIAKIVGPGSDGRQTTGIPGTPVYMAPEQLRGEKTIGLEADLYALGHIAYTLLVGTEYWADEIEAAGGGIYPLLLALSGGAKEAPSVRAARRGARLTAEFDAWFQITTASNPALRQDSASAAVEGLAMALRVEPPRRSVSSRSVPRVLAPRSVVDPLKATVAATTSVGIPKNRGPWALIGGAAAIALGAVVWWSRPAPHVVAQPSVEVTSVVAALPPPAPPAPPAPTAVAAEETAAPTATAPPASTPTAAEPPPPARDAPRSRPPSREAAPPPPPPQAPPQAPPVNTARRKAQGKEDPGF